MNLPDSVTHVLMLAKEAIANRDYLRNSDLSKDSDLEALVRTTLLLNAMKGE